MSRGKRNADILERLKQNVAKEKAILPEATDRELADATRAIIKENLRRYQAQLAESDFPVGTIGDTQRMMATLQSFEKAIAGAPEPDEESTIDLSKLSPEELEALAKLYDKAGKS